MTNSLAEKVERGNLRSVFTVDLNWGAPNTPPIEVSLDDGLLVTATNVSSYKGVRVWEVPALLDAAAEAKVDQAIAKTSTNRLVIFRDTAKQIWRWPSRTTRGAGVVSRPARHVHQVGTSDPQFEAKLDAIRLPADSTIDVNDLLRRVRGAFDVETRNETKRASKLMAQMYAAVEKGYSEDFDPKQRDHEISVTLARVLFLLFADDTEMWTDPDGKPLPDLFQDFVKEHTARTVPTSRAASITYSRFWTPHRRIVQASAPSLPRSATSTVESSRSTSPSQIWTETSEMRSSQRRRSTGRPSARRSSGPCSSPSATLRPDASLGSTTPQRRTSSRR